MKTTRHRVPSGHDSDSDVRQFQLGEEFHSDWEDDAVTGREPVKYSAAFNFVPKLQPTESKS
jgi:hypothetical protein